MISRRGFFKIGVVTGDKIYYNGRREYDGTDQIEITTLDDVIYLGMKNDVFYMKKTEGYEWTAAMLFHVFLWHFSLAGSLSTFSLVTPGES